MKNIFTNFKLLAPLRAFLGSLRKYAVLIFMVLVLGLYGLLIFQIGALSQVEPDEAKVSEQLRKTNRLKIDQASVDKIQKLEDQNIGVQTLFKTARDNPFQDN